MKLQQAQPIGENMVMVKLEKDALERAAGSLLQLADVIGPWFEKQNFGGQGKQDAQDVRKDLETGAAACTILLAAIEPQTDKKLQN